DRGVHTQVAAGAQQGQLLAGPGGRQARRQQGAGLESTVDLAQLDVAGGRLGDRQRAAEQVEVNRAQEVPALCQDVVDADDPVAADVAVRGQADVRRLDEGPVVAVVADTAVGAGDRQRAGRLTLAAQNDVTGRADAYARAGHDGPVQRHERVVVGVADAGADAYRAGVGLHQAAAL